MVISWILGKRVTWCALIPAKLVLILLTHGGGQAEFALWI